MRFKTLLCAGICLNVLLVATAGCGGGGTSTTDPTSVFAGLYNIRGPLSRSRTLALDLTAKADGVLQASGSIDDPSRAVTRSLVPVSLSGSFDKTSGQFTLSGSYAGDGRNIPITLNGGLPGASVTSAEISGTEDGFVLTGFGIFRGAAPTPTPTPSPVPTPSPTPAPTPTPRAQTTYSLSNPYSNGYQSGLSFKGRWASTNFTLFLDKGTDTRSEAVIKTQILTGFERWKTALATTKSLSFTWVASPTQADIVVRMIPSNDPALPGGNTHLGVTTVFFAPGTPRAELVSTATDKCTIKIVQDLAEITTIALAAHELGHAFGIRDHSGDASDIMFATVTPAGIVSERDANTFAYVYLTDLP
jgi:hypothetical protein